MSTKLIPFSEAWPSPSVGAVGVKNLKTGEVDTAFFNLQKSFFLLLKPLSGNIFMCKSAKGLRHIREVF